MRSRTIRLIVVLYYLTLFAVEVAHLLGLIEQSASFPEQLQFDFIIIGFAALGLVGQFALRRQRKLEALK